MSLKSMTGFARADGALSETSWHWEMRSVNGKGLELRFRLPSGFEALEIKIRNLCQAKLARGNCTLSLSLKREAGNTEIRLNEAALRQAAALAERARGLTKMKSARLDTLLAMRGVVETVELEEAEDARARLTELLLASLTEVVDRLVDARKAEGARLSQVIADQLEQIGRLVEIAANAPARQPGAVAARLKDQVSRVAETGAGLDPERLHQEALLLAAKADIQEEIDRLRAHTEAAKELLAEEKPVGRRFEFLAQEFNREANTICSKASDIEISRAGLDLKAVIDQLREQVQNIE
jgi:uncharacterized protein (TIGR00255 family)